MDGKSRLLNTHTTLEGEKLNLNKLPAIDKETARKFSKLYISGINHLELANEKNEWVLCESLTINLDTTPIEQRVIYKYIDDLVKRLGIQQGYLVKCEVVKNCGHKH